MKANKSKIFEATPRMQIVIIAAQSAMILEVHSWPTLVVVLFSAIFNQRSTTVALELLNASRRRIH